MAKKKKRKSGMMPVLVTFLVLSVVTGIIVVIGAFSGNNVKKEYVPTGSKENVIKENDTQKDAAEEWSVAVNLTNCTLYVGTVLNVTATVTPETGNVTWLSSNPDALVINPDGRLIVTGKGIATITASIGAVTDTVIIECVEEGEKSVLGFPVYDEDAGKNNVGAVTIPETINGTEPDDSFSGTTTTQAESQTMEIKATEKLTEKATEKVTENVTVKPTESATKPTVAATQPVQKPISDVVSSQMGTYLTENGFTLHSDGTYIYEKDSVYLGEVIIDGDKTHIYILQNQENFEQAAMQVIAKLIPESYETVWKTAWRAQSDMAMTVDGRNVRIVVPQAGGHKQIVIYN